MLHPGEACAHASLVSSDPANDALLMHAPSALRLTFNEDVEVLAVKLVDETGAVSPVTRIDARGASLVLTPPRALHDGANVISWRVISADGHPVGGSVTFWVGRRGTQAPNWRRPRTRPSGPPSGWRAGWSMRLYSSPSAARSLWPGCGRRDGRRDRSSSPASSG